MAHGDVNGWQIALGTLMKAPEVIRDWYDTVNDIRNDRNTRDALGSISRFSSSREARDFDPATVGYLTPENMVKINDLRADKTDRLLRSEAAPVQSESARLLNMARVDPFVGSEEGRRDFAERPEFWLGSRDTGSMAGGKGTTPAGPGNPYESQAIQQFARENADVLNAFRATRDPMAAANLAVNKDLAGGFKDVSQGVENYNKERTAEGARIADRALANYYANTPYDPTKHTEFMEGAARTGAPLKDIEGLSQHLMERNKDRVVEYRDVKVQNGPNTTIERVGFNGYGQPVTGLSTQSVNNPSDREQGLVPGKGGGGARKQQTAVVSFPGPDGMPITREVQMGSDGTFLDRVVARAVAEAKQGTPGYHVTIPQTDKQGNIKFVSYGTKPQGKSRRDKYAPPGGSATPAPAAASGGGGYSYINGKLVKN